jgi:PAS domain S-box-containing protein
MNQTSESLPTEPEAAATLDIDELPLPYVEIDARGFITRANRAALGVHDPAQGNLVGMSGWALMAIDEKSISSAAFFSAIASGGDPPVITRSIFVRSGTFRTFELHRSLIRDVEGKPAGMRMIFLDVTDVRSALDQARREQHWLESAMASLPQAVILTDTLGVVHSANRAAEELVGFTSRELTGKVIEEAMPILAYEAIDGVELNRRAVIERPCKGIATLLIRRGEQIKVEIATSPIFDKDTGFVIGVVAVLCKVGDAA